MKRLKILSTLLLAVPIVFGVDNTGPTPSLAETPAASVDIT